jgi:hypothetical protein
VCLSMWLILEARTKALKDYKYKVSHLNRDEAAVKVGHPDFIH